ncbi:MAG: 3-ketoacyl-ACP reductase [Hyphomicrobiaceae bacterium]|nr:3-ketoacyl-ACP reductase [Hyphomicrobiaceae bacterium]
MASSNGSGDGRRPVAFVTGARRGLGRAIAIHLARLGFDLVLNDLVRDADADDTLLRAGDAGASVRFIAQDISIIDQHDAFVGEALEAFGAIDCLVNNAGVQVPRRVGMLDVTPAEYDQVLDVNLRGTFFLTQRVARKMLEEPGAGLHPRSIISLTSANAGLASTDKAAYCLSKAALSMMTSLFALELGGHNISVFEVRPGLMTTDMTLSVRDKYADYVSTQTVFRRWGDPDEIGRAVAALASGAIPYTSGQIINVDGGMHIQRL